MNTLFFIGSFHPPLLQLPFSDHLLSPSYCFVFTQITPPPQLKVLGNNSHQNTRIKLDSKSSVSGDRCQKKFCFIVCDL